MSSWCSKYGSLIVGLALAATLAQAGPPAQEEPLRDPTRPLDHRPAAGSAGQEWELHSILIGAQRKLAVINGQQLRENEEIPGSGGVVLRLIEPGSVVLQQDARRWRLHLNSETVRR